MFTAANATIAVVFTLIGWVVSKRVQFSVVVGDAKAVIKDFDHKPKLDEIGKAVDDVKKLVLDLIAVGPPPIPMLAAPSKVETETVTVTKATAETPPPALKTFNPDRPA